MLPRAPLFSVAVPEKAQAVKWHFAHGRAARDGARRLPPLQGESADGSVQVAQPTEQSLSPPQHLRSLDQNLIMNLYGGRDVVALRCRGPARRHLGLANRTNPVSHVASSVSLLSAASGQDALSLLYEADDDGDWDEVRSVEALESAGSGKELWNEDPDDEDSSAVAHLMESLLPNCHEAEGLDAACRAALEEVSVVPHGAPRAEEASGVVAEALPPAPLFHRVPAAPAQSRASPPVPAASPLPNSGGLPAARSADWAVARARQAYGQHMLPVKIGQHSPMLIGQHSMMQAQMPTLDDLLAGKASARGAPRRLPRLEGPGRMPHTAR